MKNNPGLLKRFISYYKPHRKLFALDMSCSLFVAGCDLFYPQIAKNIINEYVPDRNLRMLLVAASVLLFIYLIKAVLNFVIQYWGHIMGVRMQGNMREDMFRHLQKLPFSFYDENKTGTIMSRMINDLFDLSELAHHGPENLFLSVIMLTGSFIILAGISLPLTLIIFAFIPFIVFFAVKMRTEMNDVFRRTREEIAEVNANVETSVAGIRVSRAYTAENSEINKFGTANNKFMAVRAKSYKVMGKFFSGMGLLTDILYLVVITAGGVFYYKNLINVGEFTAYLLYISSFLNPINRLINLFEQIQSGMTGFVRFVEIMDEPEEQEAPGAISAENLNGNITFDKVSFSYRKTDDTDDGGLIIKDLDLRINEGSTIALVGPSGGGKTTICHLIPRFYEINSGKIMIDNIDIKDLTRYSLRKNIGMVAQDVFMFNGTVRENIAYGNTEATDEEIIEAAKKANIHDYIMKMENGYETNIGERGVKLSGGQKQRLSIARVFLKDPPILILDEATSALDNATEMMIQESLEKLSKGRTCIIVAHRLSTIKKADEIIVVSSKGIEERGSHEKLMQKNGIYTSLYNYQFRE